jgi:DNA-binding NarL/FixJ family response regulator
LKRRAAKRRSSLGSRYRIDLLISTPDVRPAADLAARVRAQQPDVRVLYLSGYSDAPILGDQLAADTVAFLPKPFTAAALTEKVRQVLTDQAES